MSSQIIRSLHQPTSLISPHASSSASHTSQTTAPIHNQSNPEDKTGPNVDHQTDLKTPQTSSQENPILNSRANGRMIYWLPRNRIDLYKPPVEGPLPHRQNARSLRTNTRPANQQQDIDVPLCSGIKRDFITHKQPSSPHHIDVPRPKDHIYIYIFIYIKPGSKPSALDFHHHHHHHHMHVSPLATTPQPPSYLRSHTNHSIIRIFQLQYYRLKPWVVDWAID